MKTIKPASEWCEEMFGRGNWVVADEITIKAIQEDAKIQGRIDALDEALEMIVNNHSRTWQEHANELSAKLRELTKNRAPNK